MAIKLGSVTIRGGGPCAAAAVILTKKSSPERVTSAPPMGHTAVYLSSSDDAWCASRKGIWWPAQCVWVDRSSLLPEDVTPATALTYSLDPQAGLAIAAVHGQVLDGVAHVLVTGPGGVVVTQGAARDSGPRDRALAVLRTLGIAAGFGATPTEQMSAALTDHLVRIVGLDDWADSGGWTRDLDEFPSRVITAIGR